MAQEDDLELDAEQPRSSKKKLIILIAGAVVLSIAFGVAGWFLLSGDDEAKPSEASGEELAVPDEDRGEVGYHDMKPVFVVSLPGSKRLLQVGLQVRLYYPELPQFLKHNDPALRHAILNLLGAQDAEALATREGKEVLRAAIKEEINALIKKYQGPGEVDEVLFSSFVTQ
jgi:flagellar FliL protein